MKMRRKSHVASFSGERAARPHPALLRIFERSLSHRLSAHDCGRSSAGVRRPRQATALSATCPLSKKGDVKETVAFSPFRSVPSERTERKADRFARNVPYRAVPKRIVSRRHKAFV